MLAESGEERGAMMGVHRKSIHQLACVLTDLCEWVEGGMLFLGRSAASMTLGVAVVVSEAESTTAPTLSPHNSTPQRTPNTQQVREHTTAHAFMSRSRKEREN